MQGAWPHCCARTAPPSVDSGGGCTCMCRTVVAHRPAPVGSRSSRGAPCPTFLPQLSACSPGVGVGQHAGCMCAGRGPGARDPCPPTSPFCANQTGLQLLGSQPVLCPGVHALVLVCAPNTEHAEHCVPWPGPRKQGQLQGGGAAAQHARVTVKAQPAAARCTAVCHRVTGWYVPCAHSTATKLTCGVVRCAAR